MGGPVLEAVYYSSYFLGQYSVPDFWKLIWLFGFVSKWSLGLRLLCKTTPLILSILQQFILFHHGKTRACGCCLVWQFGKPSLP